MSTSTDDLRREDPVRSGLPLAHAARQVPVLLLGVALLVLGNGLQGTLLAVRGGLEGFGEQLIGLIMSAYSVGFVAGSWVGPGLIHRAGHIRTFAALASIASIATLAHALFVDAAGWTVLRFLTGASYAGLVMVAESWLNATAGRQTRGRILALYGIVVLGAWAASQLMLTVGDPAGFELFCLVSILISASLVPLALSRVESPVRVPPLRPKFRRIYSVSPLGMVGCFLVGLAMSAFWGLGPVFAQSVGLTDTGTALFMAVTMLGGLALQWPVGHLSDLIDRRTVIAGACLANLAVCGVLAAMAEAPLAWLLAGGFLFGGLGLPVYSLCVAHANDMIEQEELVSVSSGLLLVYGAGSIAGPVCAGFAMAAAGPGGLFLFSGAGLAGIVLFAGWRMTRREAPPAADQSAFVAVPIKTTHLSGDLDPRGGRTDAAAEPEEPA
jgi:MFS family permease